jgi:hypothetical protein
VNSSDAVSWPVRENWWKAEFPIQNPSQIGIGHIIEPPGFSLAQLIGQPFAMHDHQYAASNTPAPERARVTYTFDKPAEIVELQLIQHTNGITAIEGFVGPTKENLKSMGVAWSSRGDVKGLGIFPEASPDTFKFPRPGTGTVFQFVIRQTSLGNGYALYRAYPRNAQHQEYIVAGQKYLRSFSERQ